MTTLAIMRAAILDQLGNDGAMTTAQIDNAIRSSIRHYGRRKWWFNQDKDATFSTVASQEYYSSTDLAVIPNVLNIVSVLITVNGLKTVLIACDFEDIQGWQTGAVTGQPRWFTVFENQIRLYPIPDAVYTITLAINQKLTEVTADADTNAWLVEAEELIRQASKKRLALDVLNADDLASRFNALEVEAYDELLNENSRRIPRKTLRTEFPLMSNSYDIWTG